MNEKQLKWIAHCIALASQLPEYKRRDFQDEIIKTYKELRE